MENSTELLDKRTLFQPLDEMATWLKRECKRQGVPFNLKTTRQRFRSAIQDAHNDDLIGKEAVIRLATTIVNIVVDSLPADDRDRMVDAFIHRLQTRFGAA